MASRWYQNGARLSKRDVIALDEASEALAAAAATIQRINPSWSGTVIALLIKANDTVVRLQQKGATTFARYLERHPEQEAAQGTEAVEAGNDQGGEQKIEYEAK